jgi:hypothetical protein
VKLPGSLPLLRRDMKVCTKCKVLNSDIETLCSECGCTIFDAIKPKTQTTVQSAPKQSVAKESAKTVKKGRK